MLLPQPGGGESRDRRRIVGALSVLALASASALAQAPDATPGPSTPVELDKVVVTGSHIPRIEGETALPVQTITREEIERSGVTTPAQLLQRVPPTSMASTTR